MVLGTEVRAETVTISQTNSFAILTTGTQTLSFNLIDSAFGSSVAESDIVDIRLVTNLNLSNGFFVVENLGSDPTDVAFSTFSKCWLTSSHLSEIFPRTEYDPDLMFDAFFPQITLQPFEILSYNFGFYPDAREIVDSRTFGGDGNLALEGLHLLPCGALVEEVGKLSVIRTRLRSKVPPPKSMTRIFLPGVLTAYPNAAAADSSMTDTRSIPSFYLVP